jgi:NAD(P)-dependent dehydrogenase (short-subunit alcohol dehydrogenase family)
MDKVAVVTGGSSGLGFSIAKRLAGEGHAVVLIARGKDRLEARRKELEGAGHVAMAIAADVSSIEEMKAAADQIRERFGKIDFLAINAGIVEPRALFTFDDLSRMKRTIDVDLWGAVLSSRVFGPMVVEGGRILFVSSAFGLCGGAGYATYCGAKAGVINFADALRHELSCRRIKVYAAAPADIDTPQFHEEKASLPPWMSIGAARNNVMPADVAAQKILARCRGNGFLIITSLEVKFLHYCQRVLPSRLYRFILDRVFPKPASSDLYSELNRAL